MPLVNLIDGKRKPKTEIPLTKETWNAIVDLGDDVNNMFQKSRT